MFFSKLKLTKFDSHYFHNPKIWPNTVMSNIVNDCTIKFDFLTTVEEKNILTEIEPHMKRLKYEEAHWDDAIYLYREREQKNWSDINAKTIKKIQDASFSCNLIRSPYVHILDLHKDGYIKPHIDSERYCGKIVSGVSLMSDCVMRLRHNKKKDLIVDLLLKQRSLYKLSGLGRFEFTHEILKSDVSFFGNEKIERNRRISIICRDLPKENNKLVFKTGKLLEQ